MSYAPLDGGIVTSTLLKNGPDVVACWVLLLATCDKLGESNMQPSAAASLLRISDDRAEVAFALLASPDPKSRNKDREGRRIVRLEDGNWHVVSYQKYQYLASRARATQRSQKYEANKKAREAHAEAKAYICEADGCMDPAEATSGGKVYCSRHVFDGGAQ
jgi:hypothetical protein